MLLDGHTRICGLIGSPVEHSLSPMLHNGAYSELGLNYCYLPFHVQGNRLEEALRGLIALNLAGVNVTAPYKEAVLRYLQHLDPPAAAAGSVNTICCRQGELWGCSTDGGGLLWSLREMAGWHGAGGRHALILGAGGVTRAVAYALAENGLAGLVILNRTAGRAELLAAALRKAYPRLQVKTGPLNPDHLAAALDGVSLIINALPAEPFAWESELILEAGTVACDLRYYPPETPFLSWARQAGAAAAINGLGMLVGQAALSFALFTGCEPPFALMLKLAASHTAGREKICQKLS